MNGKKRPKKHIPDFVLDYIDELEKKASGFELDITEV